MIVAMAILLYVASDALGGVSAAIGQMNTIDGFMDWFPRDMPLPGLAGGLMFIISWLFAGMSVIGQPHIMVRFMTLARTIDMRQARIWYYLWFLAFYAMATAVGMLARIHIADTGTFDAELALPTMAQLLLSPPLVGLILAGIFAATMSTADSLILSCSAALTHDLLPHTIEKTWMLKLSTILITLVALVLALNNNLSVFSMVIMAWSGLASAFAPLLIVLAMGGRPSQQASIIAMIAGFSVALCWRLLGWHEFIYEGLPGIAAGLLILWIARGSRQSDGILART
jgi:Na+/proline symporter